MRFETGTTIQIRDAYAARHEPEGARVLGEFFWALLILLLALMVSGGIGFGIWEFTRPLTQDVESSVSVGARKSVTRSELQKILEGFGARAEKYEKRRTAPVGVKDPS